MLVRQRKEEGHTVRRKLLCRAIFRIRKIIKQKKIEECANRAVQQQRVPLWERKPKHKLTALRDYRQQETVLEGAEDILENANIFFTDLFNCVDAVLPDWIYDQFNISDLDSLPFFDGTTLKQLVGEMAGGKLAARTSWLLK